MKAWSTALWSPVTESDEIEPVIAALLSSGTAGTAIDLMA
jgi:hypothetical protein